jgi:hypothetical protein
MEIKINGEKDIERVADEQADRGKDRQRNSEAEWQKGRERGL